MVTTSTTVTVAAAAVVIYGRLPGSAQTGAELCPRRSPPAAGNISQRFRKHISLLFPKGLGRLATRAHEQAAGNRTGTRRAGLGGGPRRKPAGYSGSAGASSAQPGGHVPGALCLCDSVVLSSVLASHVPPPASGVSPKDGFSYQNC